MTTPCPASAALHGLVNGTLSDSEADSLQLHLEQCQSCQHGLQEIVADGDFWNSAAENLAGDEVAGPGLNRVVDELQHQSPEDAEQMGEAIELKLSFIEPPSEPGTIGRLKHYDILRVAGRGGMGIVVKAFDRTLRRVVAIKLLAPHLAGNGQARQRFVREGRSAAGICHEHVVTIHAVEESPPFIVMQYVKGETLEARIHRNGSLEVREAVRIAKQIAQGLAAAHTQGVVHRDIKPANILLENGVARVRITDFGLARAVDDASLTQSGVVAGTPQYMAPEQANGDSVDERADLFSLGSVLYTMLAGHAPFRATTTMGVLRRLCDHSARPIREINPEVPDWLVMLINRLHAKRPADRYQSAQEVSDVLERGLAAMQNAAAPTVETPKHEPATAGISEDSPIPAGRLPERTQSPPQDSPTGRQPMPRWLMLPIPIWLIAIPMIVVALGPLGQFPAEISAMLLIGLCFAGLLIAGLRPFWPASEESEELETTSRPSIQFSLRKLVATCLFQPMPMWVVFVLVGICVAPFAPSGAMLAVVLAAVWIILTRIFRNRWKTAATEGESGSLRNPSRISRENFVLARLMFRAAEVAPGSFSAGLAWLFVWLTPAFVWAAVFFVQENRIRPESSFRHIDKIDTQVLLVAFGVSVIWMLVGLLWFRRRRPDGSTIFTRPARLKGVMGTLGLASIFAVCGYQTWKSDVYRRAINRQIHEVAIPEREFHSKTAIAQNIMIQASFEAAVDDLEVVIDFPGDRELKLTPAHHGVTLHVSESPGTYEWNAILKGQHVASGTVTLVSGQVGRINVPRPKLAQLIAGRWSGSDSTGFAGMDLGYDDGSSGVHVEFEFESDRATIAAFESDQIDHDLYQIRIDETVTPALIDLSLPDGRQLIGIIRFQSGRSSNLQNSMMGDGESGDGGIKSFEGGMSMGFGAPGGAPGMVGHDEPDRLLLCVTEGSGLRPWEFQSDGERGHVVFALVRSHESGSLREQLALNPVKLESSADLVTEAVQAWSRRLKIKADGTNSVGMNLVLVPPAAYHVVDQPELSALRRQLPEPRSNRDSTEQQPDDNDAMLKQPIRLTHKVVSYPFVMSRRPVTIDQFRQFIEETGYVTAARGDVPSTLKTSADPDKDSTGESDQPETRTVAEHERIKEAHGGWRRESGVFKWVDGLDWHSSIRVEDAGIESPVSVISWHDAAEFCKWLSEKEGRQYRLPGNEEWVAAMQLGAARKPLPVARSDERLIDDDDGWFDARSPHPLGIIRNSDIFAEWTQDAQFNSPTGRMVLVHHEVNDDGVRFYSGIQFHADKSFRADSVGFRVVAELQVLAAERPAGAEDDRATVLPPELRK